RGVQPVTFSVSRYEALHENRLYPRCSCACRSPGAAEVDVAADVEADGLADAAAGSETDTAADSGAGRRRRIAGNSSIAAAKQVNSPSMANLPMDASAMFFATTSVK